MNFNRYKDHKEASQTVSSLYTDRKNCVFIHYSCESFYNIPDDGSARITSIAVKHYATNQTTSFSIHKTAELKGIKFSEIVNQYDMLEREMLDDFFDYVEKHPSYTWIHWNMRNIVYGFQAIEHRYKVLGGSPIRIDDERKVDLSQLLINLYGVNYIGHPRLEKIKELNKISYLGYLSGKEEADCFVEGAYIKLHQSTLAKVDFLMNVLERIRIGNFKTNARWKEIYGLTPQSILKYFQSRWWGNLILFLLTSIVSGVIGFLISFILS